MGKVLTQGAAGFQLARNLLARTRSGSSDYATPPAPNGEGAIVQKAPAETK